MLPLEQITPAAMQIAGLLVTIMKIICIVFPALSLKVYFHYVDIDKLAHDGARSQGH